MRPRRRRSHSRRQTGVIFNPGGGILLDSGGQGGVAGDNPNQSQHPFSTSAGVQVFTTEHVQPGHHAVPSSASQSSSSSTASASASPSHASSMNVSPTRISGSSISSSLRSNSSSARPGPSSVSSFPRPSGASATMTSAVQYSASALSVPTVAASPHSVGFYVGIGFAGVVVLACVFSFAAWLLRLRRRSGARRLSNRRDVDVEGLGLGLGLYLDKPTDGFETREVHSSSFPETTHTTSQGNRPRHPAAHGLDSSRPHHPSALTRPAAPHVNTNNSIQAPDRLLGPLRVRNYVAGDYLSSCDEAAPSPRPMRGVGGPLELQPGRTPRYLGAEGQVALKPWAPLNIKPRTPKQVNTNKVPPRNCEASPTAGEEQNYFLPTPPFGYTRARGDCEGASPNGWGDSLRSSIHAALAGSGDYHKTEDNFPALPGSYSRSDRWRTVLSSQKAPVADAVTSGSMNRTLTKPETNAGNHPLSSYGQGVATFDSIGLCLRMEERKHDSATSEPSTRPPTISKKRATERGGGSKRCAGSVKPRTLSREGGGDSLLRSTARRSAKRSLGCTKMTRMSMTSRVRPEFLRQPTAGSVTSFSSEASEPPGALTEEELRAKRAMMLRARRKCGMGAIAGTGKGRLSGRITQSRESPGAELSEN